MSGGSSKPATQTVVQQQTNDPWAPLVPHLTNLFTQGQAALEATPKTNYAGPNQDQKTAVDWMRGLAPTLSTGSNELRQLGMDTLGGKYLDPAQSPGMAQTVLDTAGGKYLDPDTNPFLKSSIEGAIGLNTQNLNRNILPGLADQAILGGAYGGSGYGVAQAVLANDTYTANTNAAVNAYNQNFQAERERQLAAAAQINQNYQLERERQVNAGSLLNQANTLDLAPAQLMDLIGSQQQSWDQAALTAAIDAPWAGLDRYASLLGLGTGYGTSSGTSTTTGTPAKGSSGSSFLQGALGGASAGSAFGPWGAGVGGILGGLGGLFG